MAGAIRSHASERGFDWRGFSMLAFGGAGPLHACHVAELLDAPEVIFPPLASVLSAFGALVTPVSLDLARGSIQNLATLDWEAVTGLYEEMKAEISEALAAAGCAAADIDLAPSLDLRYVGQKYDLTVPVEPDFLITRDTARIRELFALAYERVYQTGLEGHAVEVVNWRLRGSVPRHADSALDLGEQLAAPSAAHRRVVFPSGAVDQVPVRVRASFRRGEPLAGPAIIEERDTTIVIPPNWQVELGDMNCLFARPNVTPAP
jgi:N-methylhydantoinase A